MMLIAMMRIVASEIPLREACGAIHGAAELRLARYSFPAACAPACSLITPAFRSASNRHLLARHRIKRKTCCHSSAVRTRAMADHQVLDRDERKK